MSLNSSLLLAASALPSLVEGVTQAKHFVSLAAAEISTVPDFPGTAEPDNVATISDIDKFLAAFGIDDSEQPENDVQDQDKDHVLPDTGAALVGGPPAGAGSNPITNPLPLIPDPAAQPDPAAPDQPGGAQDGGAAAHEEPGSDSEAGSQHDGAGDDEADEVANEEAAHSDDADQSHEQQEHESDAPSKAETQSSSSSSSSSSSTSHSGGGGGGNGFHIGAGGPDFSGVGPSVAGGFGASLIGHSLLTGDTGISVPGGSGNHDSSAQPPGQVPDMYAAWAAARDAYLAAEQQVEARADEIDDTRCTAGDAMVYIETAKAQIASIEEQISSKVSFITTNLTGIANLNTKIAENDFQIERWIAKRAANQIVRQEAQQGRNAASEAIRNACAGVNATQDEAVWAHQSDIIIEQGKIISAFDKACLDAAASDQAGIRAIQHLRTAIQSHEAGIIRLEAANETIDNTIQDGRSYIDDLRKYIVAQTHAIAEFTAQIQATFPAYASCWHAYTAARELMESLSAFRGDDEVPFDAGWSAPEEKSLEPYDDGDNADAPGLPPLPPGYHAFGTGATHTTTTSNTTFVPDEAQSGSHPAAGPMSFNVAPDQPANPESSMQAGTNDAQDPLAQSGASVQVRMTHPATVADSPIAILNADAVAHELPIVHAIVDAWLRTLPASTAFEFQGFDILNANQGEPVTLAIRFAPRAGHAEGATVTLPADAVAVLTAALQGAATYWEHEQENSAREAIFAAALHHGTADLVTPDSVMLAFEFLTRPDASVSANVFQHSHDVHAIEAILVHWMASVDPAIAATVVAFDIVDLTERGDIQLQVLVNALPVVPDVATLMALQNAMQDYLARPETPVPEQPASPAGTSQQALSVVGVAEHGAF